MPITGGNVSLYNETDGRDLPDARHRHGRPHRRCVDCRSARVPQQPGEDIVLLGESTAELGGSEYLKTVHGLVAGGRRRSISGASAR